MINSIVICNNINTNNNKSWPIDADKFIDEYNMFSLFSNTVHSMVYSVSKYLSVAISISFIYFYYFYNGRNIVVGVPDGQSYNVVIDTP